MYTDLMVDLEYLASDDNAVITQISAVPFDITNGYFMGMENGETKEGFDQAPCMQAQLNDGRVIDASTMAFWMNQCAADGRTPSWLDDPTDTLDEVLLENLITWGGEHFDWEEVRVWSHVGCDMGKLNHAYRSYSEKAPWGRGHEWHLQTLRKLAKMKATPEQVELIEIYRGLKTHDAHDDCVAQIKVVTLCWDILGMES